MDRRRFLQMAGSASVVTAMGGRAVWAASAPPVRFAYVGAERAIHVYAVSPSGRLKPLQTIATRRAVAMQARAGRLYVANGVAQVHNLPRGSVEAYALDGVTGRLERLNRVGLSLSGTQPRDLAIAPDGRSLVVAIHGGGAYNVLSLDERGLLGKVTGIRKEIGSGPHVLQTASHPSALAFDRRGQLLSADFGADRLSVLALENGELSLANRCAAIAGSGPASMVLHPSLDRAYVANALNGSVSSFAFESGAMRPQQTVQASSAGEHGTLAMHPSGEMLLSSHGRGLQIWNIGTCGELRLSRTASVHAHALQITPDGRTLFALTGTGITTLRLDGDGDAPAAAAALPQALSIALV